MTAHHSDFYHPQVFLTRKPNPRQKILVPCQLSAPRENCYVCAEKREVHVKLDLGKTTVRTLVDKILKKSLNFVAPDVELDGKGVILVSSEEGETDDNNDKTLESLSVADGAILACDDFLQDYNVKLFLFHR